MGRFFEIFINDEQHRFGEDEVPLGIGSGGNAAIVLPDVDGIVANIDLHDGKYLFLQSIDEQTEVFHNDQLVTDTAWIKSGDRTRIGDRVIVYRVAGDRVEIVVKPYKGPATVHPGQEGQSSVFSENIALPPVAPPPGGSQSGLTKKILVGLVFLLLVMAAVFVLTAHTLEIAVQPSPDTLAIAGPLPLLTLGDRYLGVVGTYRLQASRKGYQPLTEQVKITSQGPSRYAFHLQPLPGQLTVTSTPPGVQVYIDDTLLGTAPLIRETIPAGNHVLRCTQDAYQAREQQITMPPAGRQRVDCELQPALGRVFIVTDPAGAAVLSGEEQLGESPLTILLKAGKQRLLLQKEGYKSASLRLTVVPGTTLTPPLVSLQRQPVTLTLSSRPIGARVRAGKKVLGATPLKVHWLPGSRHGLVFSLPGYVAVRKKVVVEKKNGQTILVTLSKVQKKAQHARAAASAPIQASSRVEKTPTGHPLSDPVKNVSSPEMVHLAPATFTMGASRREPGRRANESQHRVSLTRPFLLGVHEVTNKEFRRFKPQHRAGAIGGQSLDADQLPVVKVSWQEAAAYCNWLSARQGLEPYYQQHGKSYVPVSPTGNGYRLPFEAEWAYAARMVGRTRPGRYPWDGVFPPRTPSGNYADEAARTLIPVVIKGYYDGFPVLAPVKSFPRNMGGFFDMGGNVSEWCHDYYSPHPAPVSGRAVDPMGPAGGRHHVVRGSSWRDGAMTELRLSYRGYADKGRDNLGFRVARFDR